MINKALDFLYVLQKQCSPLAQQHCKDLTVETAQEKEEKKKKSKSEGMNGVPSYQWIQR